MWSSSNESFLLIICYVKEQNKLCCIIIPHCDIKPKCINIVFVLKMRKGILKVKYIRLGKMMLLRGINDNILISHLYYLGVYQY